jgi:hypothetical protein
VQVAIFIISIFNIFLLIVGIHAFINACLIELSKALKLFTSISISLCLLSFSYYLMLVFDLNFGVLLIILSIINAIQIYSQFPNFKTVLSNRRIQLNNLQSVIICVAILLSCLYFLFHGSKYGDSDAWAFWNTHAKFLYFNQHWKGLFADLNTTHADYPLMLPSIIAFFWKTINCTSFIIPLIFSLLVLIAVELLVYFSLMYKATNTAWALLGLFILVSDVKFQVFDASQCADIILSFFILLTIVLFNNLKHTSDKLWYFIGFICASCMWIKNEGVLFYLIFTTVLLFNNYKNFTFLFKYLIGSLLPILIVVSFKLFYAPANDLVGVTHNQVSIFNDIENTTRYFVIASTLLKTLIDNFWIFTILILLMIFLNIKGFKSSSILVLVLLLSGYLIVFLFTPSYLQWHLSTALNRLLYHIYPSAIYLSLMSFKEFYGAAMSHTCPRPKSL